MGTYYLVRWYQQDIPKLKWCQQLCKHITANSAFSRNWLPLHNVCSVINVYYLVHWESKHEIYLRTHIAIAFSFGHYKANWKQTHVWKHINDVQNQLGNEFWIILLKYFSSTVYLHTFQQFQKLLLPVHK